MTHLRSCSLEEISLRLTCVVIKIPFELSLARQIRPNSSNSLLRHLLSTEWVDYVEEPMKYQALRPHFFSVGGWGWWGMWCGIRGASDAPHDAPMLFFDNLVKKLDNLSTSNIDIYPSTLEICINNLLKLFFFGSGPHQPPPPPTYQGPPNLPENHTYAQHFQPNPTYLLTVNV